ncbi:Fc.00g016630.m01.CDS01 [Cosmosporella sp. VM-42]
MASTVQSAVTTSTLSLSASTSSSLSSTSPTPLTIILRSSIDGTSDFYPFDDIAALNGGSDGGFTFKELFETGIDGGQEIILFESGCQVDGIADCTRACNDTEIFFGSLETFYNCAALASIAYWTQDAKSYYVSEATEFNASSIMGSGTLAEFDGKPVLNSFIACAKDSCDNDGLSASCDHSIDALSNETSTAREIFDAMDTFCPDLAAEINPDIFGPGVLISYVLQVCFSSMLYLFLKGFTIYVRYTQDTKPKPKLKPFALKRSLTRVGSKVWQDSDAMSRTSIAIATTLVEFQEAQAWFVFAVQIASILAIVVNSQEGTFWGEIIVNDGIAFHVSQNGVLPMFLIQICLHHESIRNWHTFAGFIIEYVLAIVATTQKIYFKDAFELFKKQNPITACGLNPSPRTYCAATRSYDGSQLSFFPHPLLYKMVFLVLDTIAIIVLILDQLAWTLRTHNRTQHKQFGRYRVGRWPDGWMKRHGLRVKRWIWRILEVSYLVVNILYMVSLIQVINSETFAANKWSYGQIIAVTVWGPVIVKLFDLILSGPPKNGRRLNSGPPRLRIDNVINGRVGTSADEDLLTDDEKYDPETAELDDAVMRPDLGPSPGNEPGDSREEAPRNVAPGEGKGQGGIIWKRKQSQSR